MPNGRLVRPHRQPLVSRRPRLEYGRAVERATSRRRLTETPELILRVVPVPRYLNGAIL